MAKGQSEGGLLDSADLLFIIESLGGRGGGSGVFSKLNSLRRLWLSLCRLMLLTGLGKFGGISGDTGECSGS